MEVESLAGGSFVEDLTNSGRTDAEVRIAEARTGLCSSLYFGQRRCRRSAGTVCEAPS